MPNKQKVEKTSYEKVMGMDQTSDLATLQSLGCNTMTSFGTAWVETLSEMGSEVLSFVADRIKEDVKTQHEILHCDDMTELQQIQARFVKNAIEQYTAETGKLVAMSQKVFPTPADSKN